MEFLQNLLFRKKDGLYLKYDKNEDYWTVKKAGSILYLGTKEQCEKYLSHHTSTSVA